MKESANLPGARGERISERSLLPRRLDAIFTSRWFAYASIFLLQLRCFYYIWHKDLIDGDTAAYFGDASRWFDGHGLGNLIYSPLYIVYYGSLLRITHDALAVQILHRMLIVLAIGALLLAVARSLLPPIIAWFVAAWWVVLPVNYDARFEVHLFVVLPVLAALWVAARPRPTSWTRAATLAIFAGAALLIRLELLIAFGCFGVVCANIEFRDLRRNWSPRRLFTILLPYFIVSILLGWVLIWFVRQCPATLEQELYILHAKESTTMGQWYAFGYAQRHADWSKDPWGAFPDLMTRDFGLADPSLLQMWTSNRRALIEHVLWHYRLLPAGMQLGLFGRAEGTLLPDIQPWYIRGSAAARILCYALLLVLAIASGVWLLGWKKWRGWFGSRRLAWIAMACVAVSAPMILLTSPARPEIFACHTIVLIIVVGAAVFTIASKLPCPSGIGLALPAAFLTAMIGLPFHFPRHEANNNVASSYERLKPYQWLIEKPNVVFLHEYGTTTLYFAEFRGRSIYYNAFEPAAWPAGESLADMLDRKGVNLIYLDRPKLRNLAAYRPGAVDALVDDAHRYGWRILQQIDAPREGWILLARETLAGTSW